MLVIISGVETTGKKLFASEVLSKMSGDIDLIGGFKLSLKTHPYEILSPKGKVVFRAGYDADPGVNTLLVDASKKGALNEAGVKVLKNAEDLYNAIVLDNGREGHLKDVFVNIYYDYGIVKISKFFEHPMGDPIRRITYETDIIEAYRNRKSPVYAISGSFGKHVIDRVRQELGAENVFVLNIIRNPSVCYLLNEKPADQYSKEQLVNRTPEMDREKLKRSLFNAIHLKSFEDITTVRFEDILSSGKFTVAGVELEIPEHLKSSNGFLTDAEKAEFIPLGTVDSNSLDAFNTEYSNYQHLPEAVGEKLDFLNREQGTNFTREDIDAMLPSNVFAELGYEPMTRDEIINK